MNIHKFHKGGKPHNHPHSSVYRTEADYAPALVSDSPAPKGTTYDTYDDSMNMPDYVMDPAQRIAKQLFMETGGEKDPNKAVSPAGAMGKWQIMPATKKDLEDRGYIPKGLDPFDPHDSKIMRDGKINSLLKLSFISNPPKPIPEVNKLARIYSSYNWGEGYTMKALEKAKADGVNIYGDPRLWLDYLPHETSNYINKILFND